MAKLIAIAALIVFELTVAALMLFPRVDDRYRTVFIERASECWPRPVSGEIAFDEPVSMLGTEAVMADAAKAILRCGWINPDGNGVWSVGPESRLLLQLPPGQAATLELDLRAFWHTQRIDITANGEPLTEWTLDLDTEQQTLALPATDDGRMELAFHFRDAVSPRDLKLLADGRALAIRLFGVTLHKD